MRSEGRKVIVTRFLPSSVLCCIAAAVCLGTPSSPTDAGFSDAQTNDFVIRDNVDLVLLDVSVTSGKGQYVSGLTQSEFRITEDGRARDIVAFEKSDAPVTIGLVVDNSGSMAPKRPEVIMAGLAFARESNPRDQFFVVNFNNSVMRGLPPNTLFTDNLQQLRAALYFGQAKGQTALYDAVGYSLRHLERSPLERRTLIVVTDGGDNVSTTSIPELTRLVEASRATIYTIGLFDPGDPDLRPRVLRHLANISGGEFFEPATLGEIVPLFQRISKDVRARYTLGFRPDEAHDKRTTRTVKVIAEDHGRKLNVRTRTTYSTVPMNELMAAKNRSEP